MAEASRLFAEMIGKLVDSFNRWREDEDDGI